MWKGRSVLVGNNSGDGRGGEEGEVPWEAWRRGWEDILRCVRNTLAVLGKVLVFIGLGLQLFCAVEGHEAEVKYSYPYTTVVQ